MWARFLSAVAPRGGDFNNHEVDVDEECLDSFLQKESNDEPKIFSRTIFQELDEKTPCRPYLTFTTTPGDSQHLIIKVWSYDEGSDESVVGVNDDIYANAFTGFAFGKLQDEENGFQKVFSFQTNHRPLGSLQCHTNEWKMGVPAEADDCHDTCHCQVNEFLETLTQPPSRRVVVCAFAQYPCWKSSVSKMEVQMKPWRDGDGWQAESSDEEIVVVRRSGRHLQTRRSVGPEETEELSQQQLYSYIEENRLERREDVVHGVRQAIDRVPLDHPQRPRWLMDLALILSDRYNAKHVMEDLEQALSITREVITSTPIHHPDRLNRIRMFVYQLRMRFCRTNEVKHLDEPISITRKAIAELSPDDPERANDMWALAQMLGQRCCFTGDMDDMKEALRLSREAIAATDSDSDLRWLMMASLGQCLNISYNQTKDLEELNEAIDLVRQVVASIPHDVVDIASYYCILGNYLDKRFSHTQSIKDRDESTKYFRKALWCEKPELKSKSERGVESHIHAGRRLLSRPDILDLGPQSYEDAVLAVSFIPQSASHTASAADTMDLLLDASGVASDAAAIALHFDKGTDEAIRLLEAGRGVVAGNIHNLRGDISELREQDPRTADLLESVTRRLDAGAIRDEAPASTLTFASSSTDQRHWDDRQLGGLLNVIRKKDGFDRFFMPPVEEKITHAAALGPIVILNVSVHRCDALIVERFGTRTVPLPNLTYEAIQDRARMNEIQSMRTLEWLWDYIVDPVLRALGFVTPPSEGSWPHIWWIPTGLLTRFPLHAAGYYLDDGDRTALDRVISSYSSSIKTIISMRHRRQNQQLKKTNGSIVLISMKETPGLNPLAYTDDEINAVRTLCSSSPFQDLSVISPQPKLEEITSAIKTCSIFHFAGHGQAETKPLESHLCLYDGDRPLTVERLIETNLSSSQPFLAYLSACGTGKNAEDHSADESLHLASVFHLAGFRHVIGTLWEVDDHLCVDMARTVYESLGKDGLTDEAVSTALHQAIRSLRREWLGEGVRVKESGRRDAILSGQGLSKTPLWVPYIHFGV
ncbi:hypothetical protein CP532_6106 [Ophiocordyceps camponoti-leonardi (nom. inval.)]|nr:hypothetical protein CP532_6106 [Ophiocordyceps camponoti-leonardi (nom. inval.)]